jgi:hypothetical protein
VRVHLAPAPIVARVSTWTAAIRSPIAPWLARELAVTSHLARAGALVVPPTDLLDPGPHEHDGLGLSFFRYAERVVREEPSREDLRAMLADLHSTLRGYDGELPFLAPPFHDIPRSIERIAALGTLPPADVDLLRRFADRLLPFARASEFAAVQPLHGDAHVGNLIPTRAGWLWNDFEDTCVGPVEWDLVNIDPERPDLTGFRAIRQLHAVCWTYALQPELADWLPFVSTLLDELKRA